jgi:hypothetical protein
VDPGDRCKLAKRGVVPRRRHRAHPLTCEDESESQKRGAWDISRSLITKAVQQAAEFNEPKKETAMSSNGKTLVSDADHVQLERLVTEAAWRVDEGRSDTLYELFIEDGMLVLGTSELNGHDAIRNWGRQLEDAQTYKCIRHVAGNMRFNLVNEREAEGVTILTVFMDDETSSSVPWVVGEDHDRFVRTEQGWRFKSRQWKQLFARPKAQRA